MRSHRGNESERRYIQINAFIYRRYRVYIIYRVYIAFIFRVDPPLGRDLVCIERRVSRVMSVVITIVTTVIGIYIHTYI